MLEIDYGETGEDLIKLDTKELDYMIKNLSLYIKNIKDIEDPSQMNILNNIMDLKMYNREFVLLSLPQLKFTGKEVISIFIYKHLLTYILNYNGYVEGFRKDLIEYGKEQLDYKLAMNSSLRLDEQSKLIEDMFVMCEYIAGEHIIKLSDLIGNGIKFIDEIILAMKDINEKFKINKLYKDMFSVNFLKGLNVEQYNLDDRIVNNYKYLTMKLNDYFDEALIRISDRHKDDGKFDDENFADTRVRYEYIYSILFDVIKFYFLHKVCIYNESDILVIGNQTSSINHYTSNSWAYLFYLEISKIFHTRNKNILKDLTDKSPILRYGVKDVDGTIDLMMEENNLYGSLSQFLKNVELGEYNHILNVSTFLYYLFLVKGMQERSTYNLYYNYENELNINKDNIKYDYAYGDDEVLSLSINYVETKESDDTKLLCEYVVEDILKYPSILGDIKLEVESYIDGNPKLLKAVKSNNKSLGLGRDGGKIYEIFSKHILEFLTGDTYELSYDVLKLKETIKRGLMSKSRDSTINTLGYIVGTITTSLMEQIDFKYPLMKNSNNYGKMDISIRTQESFLRYIKTLITRLYSLNVIGYRISYNKIDLLGDKVIITDNIFDNDRLYYEDLLLSYLNEDIDINRVKLLLKDKIDIKDLTDNEIEIKLKSLSKVEYNLSYSSSNDLFNIESKMLIKVLIKIIVYEELTLYNIDKTGEGFKPMLNLICDMLLVLILKKNSSLDKDFTMFYEEDYLRYYIYDIDKYMNQILNNKSLELKDVYVKGLEKMNEFQAALQIAFLKENAIGFDDSERDEDDDDDDDRVNLVRGRYPRTRSYPERDRARNREPLSQTDSIIKEVINIIDIKDVNNIFNIKLESI